jgi:hypothetical protein
MAYQDGDWRLAMAADDFEVSFAAWSSEARLQ